MKKQNKYAVNGAIIGGAVFGIKDTVSQLSEMEVNTTQQFDWPRLFLAVGQGLLLGGAGGFTIGAYTDYKNTLVQPIQTDSHLVRFSDKLKLDKNDPLYIKLSEKADLLASLLKSRFGSLIQSVSRLGSTVNGTALKHKFDIDLGVNFRSNSFNSIDDMYDSVFSFFESLIGRHSVTRLRRQKKSIGVYILIGDQEHKIDIAPCKLSKNSRGAGYLRVNDNSLFGRSTITKTNIKTLSSVKLSITQQRITVFLKKWRDDNDLPMGSHLLQNLVLDAYAYAASIPNGFTAKIVMVLRHISRNLDVAVIRSKENSNNVITNIPEVDKARIISAAKEIVEDYDYQPNSILNLLKKSN
jgi:hypothetical protein